MNLWTRKIPETKETRTTCTNKYLYLMILGYNLSLFWSSDSISVRLDLGWTVGSFFKGPWTWSLKVDLSGSSRAFGLDLEETVMNRSSSAFGLNLEERLDVWICRRCWSKGPLGLDLGWTDDERWCFLQGPSRLGLDEQRMSGFVDVVDPKGPLGLDPWGWTVDERWTLSSRAVGS